MRNPEPEEQTTDPAHATVRDYLRVAVPSAIGVALFLVPIRFGGDVTIVMGVITSTLQALIGDRMALFTTPIFVTGALLSVAFTYGPTTLKARFPYLDSVFETNTVWLVMRVIAGIGAPMTMLTLGPAWVHGAQTGGTAYVEIAGLIFLIIGVACLLLPFLTEFGLLEFVGTLMRAPFKRIFNLPGRATIDTLASWVGASSVAILVTVAVRVGLLLEAGGSRHRHQLLGGVDSVRGAHLTGRRHR